ncbi:MAG: endo alpha-1,4 polygalactosaminidase [Chloroflexi bacterium]|nr:endo alpha-1,4 polygalactosaminidase [Chloroflexota bacterium]
MMNLLAAFALATMLVFPVRGAFDFQADQTPTSTQASVQPIDYRGEMVRFVAAIAKRARASNPQFGVFAQNAAELGAQPGYLETLTGIVQEDLHYGYVQDGQATPQQVTKELETQLDRFKANGKLVLTIDYPFRNENTPQFDLAIRQKIDSAYRRSSAKGYVPYATVRGLDYLVVNPGHEPHPNKPAIANWPQVREWAYQLQPSARQNRSDFLRALGDSKFDLVVLDYSFDGSEAMKFTPGEIASLKKRLGGKVLAYLSIGEAEDYRWYWQGKWDANHDGRPDRGAPTWLGPENPNWPGNYQVRYWYPGWQSIVFAYLDKISAQGFDGVYLDLVDAYGNFE